MLLLLLPFIGFSGGKDKPKLAANTIDSELKQYLEDRYIPLPSFTLKDFDLTVNPDEPEAELSYTVFARNLAKVSGNRMFLSPGFLSDGVGIPKKDKERTYPLELINAYSRNLELTIELPEGLSVESLPESITKQSPYGTYNLAYTQEGDNLKLKRAFTRNNGKFSVEDYNKYREFTSSVSKADRKKVVYKLPEKENVEN